MEGHKPRKVDAIMKVTLFLCASLDGFIRPLQFRIFIRRVGVRYVPEAEVIPGILNVGFGGVVYHGVTESEFEYNGWGGESA